MSKPLEQKKTVKICVFKIQRKNKNCKNKSMKNKKKFGKNNSKKNKKKAKS